jgi:hypothetical protein
VQNSSYEVSGGGLPRKVLVFHHVEESIPSSGTFAYWGSSFDSLILTELLVGL